MNGYPGYVHWSDRAHETRSCGHSCVPYVDPDPHYEDTCADPADPFDSLEMRAFDLLMDSLYSDEA